MAIVYPDRMSLAQAVKRLVSHGVKWDGGRDYGGTLSVYLRDPDNNGIELYYDRPEHEWVDAQGRLVMKNDPFDVQALVAEASAAV